MASVKYSIILPVRNGGTYIKDCVSSILSQTFTDFELLILDNCSTDGTSEWLHSLTDPRIKLFPAETSLSIEENWGRITRIPKSEFITLIGHDDILYPDYLSVMDCLIHNHPNASLYQTHFHYIGSAGAVIRRCKPMDAHQSAAEFVAFILSGFIDIMGTGFMMRSADYDALGGIPPYPNLLFADFEIWIQLSLLGYKATAFEECFAFRLHQSTTTTSTDLKFQHAFRKVIDYLESLKEVPLLDPVIRRYSGQFVQQYCKGLAHRLMRTPIRKREGQTVKSFIQDCCVFAARLDPQGHFDPNAVFSIRLAMFIDRFWLTRHAFLLFKKIYSRPIYS